MKVRRRFIEKEKNGTQRSARRTKLCKQQKSKKPPKSERSVVYIKQSSTILYPKFNVRVMSFCRDKSVLGIFYLSLFNIEVNYNLFTSRILSEYIIPPPKYNVRDRLLCMEYHMSNFVFVTTSTPCVEKL